MHISAKSRRHYQDNMITSTANAQVKNLAQLIKKSKVRTEQDVYVVEGVKMFQEAPKDEIVKVYVSEELYEKGTLRENLEGIPYEVLKTEVFNHVADTKTPQGVLCVMKQKKYTLEQLMAGKCPLLLVLENLQDPGNLGTMMRTSEGAGVTGVLLSRGCVDIYNPKTIQATMGALARVKLHYCHLPSLIASLDVPVYGTFLDGNDMYQENLSVHGLIVMGNEGNGISEEVGKLINRRLYIPNYPQERETSESLNVAVATSIVCAEFRRRLQG